MSATTQLIDMMRLSDRERDERIAVIIEARSWLRTPYVKKGMVKGQGGGCDCGTFCFCVYRACGLVPDEAIGVFSSDWFCHTTEERYMMRILRHAHKVAEAISQPSLDALPGNIVLCRVAGGKVYNHGGIITQWPKIIHSVGAGVHEVDAARDPMWAYQEIAIFDPWLKRRETSSFATSNEGEK